MGRDPYKMKMFEKDPYAKKTEIIGELVVVLDGTFDNRGLELIIPASRCLQRSEIHELILTDEDSGPGSKVNKIAYIGFFEVKQGGVILKGDKVFIGNQYIGEVTGYDETHMPNHLNIVIFGKPRISGLERGLELRDKVIIKKEKQ